MDKQNPKNLITELHALLKKYNAEITADDHWIGCPECGQDVRMTIEFNNYDHNDIDIGNWIDGEKHGAMRKDNK